jgi:peptidase S41-like protein
MIGMTSLLLAFLLASGQPATARPVSPGPVVDALAAMVAERYQDETVAKRMAADLAARRARGEYDALATADALASRLTADLQAISHDKHLRVFAEPRQPPQAPGGGVGRVEVLAGGTGLVEVTSFAQPPDVFEPAWSAAMAKMSNARALVIDLRGNGGGRPDTVATLIAYLLEPKSVLLATITTRAPAGIRDVRTPESVTGPRFGAARPVYVLIGPRTFSGAEACAYDLQALKRATIVGEVSGGGANPGGQAFLPDGMAVFMPTGHVANAITHANWEGAGVKPDIAAGAADALGAALGAITAGRR